MIFYFFETHSAPQSRLPFWILRGISIWLHGRATATRGRVCNLLFGAFACLLFAASARSDTIPSGATTMSEPLFRPVLVQFYQELLADDDLERFRAQVEPRYMPHTLARLLHTSDPLTRRAALTALDLLAETDQDDQVAEMLKDRDPLNRELAKDVLWAIWFRADSPENSRQLKIVRALISQGRPDEAVELATMLINRAPNLAEAYNQRAVALFVGRRYIESAADCKVAIRLKPCHFGALGGLALCQSRLGLNDEAIKTYRRALKLEPENEGIQEAIAVLEAQRASEKP